MLAVFDRAVAPSPEGLRHPGAAGDGAAGLAERFRDARPGAVTVALGPGGANSLAYSSHGQSPLLPRLFAATDEIFCLFQGTIENIAVLKQQYGLHNKGSTEINIIIEAYRTLRDRGPYPADQVVRDINGKFAFVLYDCSNNSVFMATDADGSVPFYWGVDPDSRLVVSDDDEIVNKACGKSSAPFPKGFFFTTSGGLQSYEHPMNEVKPVPRLDSKGEVCGTTYTVDAKAKKDSSIPRVGSAADWSSQY
ncbi:stem-specific protein TSJT1 [Oryza sativa Japonica Group]|jgi:hypothetical protein|uniref:Stem-specific protein TSJT1, putative, expressed n=4 Tax=Oryza TaxID=4527 RepID=Q6F390_ORYSJ|nr:stem-specific protein TSJT1 [Oryza sativa Japonica Group]AAT76419.1 expressed protein [Oryza sativa Japonica Group]ABF99340.1 Stem-specific protein TSJT1, putative, expressed [Oryza sativa Japonica Group]KAF2941802.1 hypothetical protein DAI22_03g373900 [Oryza sativa Japonica Group]